MIKQIALLKAKAGMDHEAFVKRYEEGHVPLIEELVPHHDEYRRNFIIPGSLVQLDHIEDAPPPPDFDVITALWYKDQSKLADLSRDLAETDKGEQIAEDETHLFDRTKMVMFAAEEHVTPKERLQPRPAGHQGPPQIKQVALLRRKSGMSREDFIAYYENNHAPLAERILTKNGKCIFAEYSRSFPEPTGGFDMSHVEHAAPEVDFDVLSEFWFWNQQDYDDFIALCADPAIGDALAKDEENFFDRSKITIFMVDERRPA